MTENKEIVSRLKESIEYRSKHKQIINEFLFAVRNYFLEKYNFHIRTLTGITWFAIEKDINYYYGGEYIRDCDFKFTSKVLFEFCNEFDCEFQHTACDGSRYFFTLNDVDMSNAFLSKG